MNIKEWKKTIQAMDQKKLKELGKAFEALKNFPEFKAAFTGTGLFSIGTLINNELKCRALYAGNNKG